MSFLPENFSAEDYNIRRTLGYWSPRSKESRIRILAPALIGWNYWNTEGQRVKVWGEPKEPEDIRFDDNGIAEEPKVFFGLLIYSYEHEAIAAWDCTQQSIIGQLVSLAKSSDLLAIDLTIIREEIGNRVQYHAVGLDPSKSDPKIATQLAEYEIDMGRIFGMPEKPPEPASKPSKAKVTKTVAA